MTTILEDQELEAEVQELYLKSKQWILDLEFLREEIKIVEVILTKHFKIHSLEEIKPVLETASRLQSYCVTLKYRIKFFLQNLKELILDTKKPFALQIIEAHSLFAIEIRDIFVAYHNFKDLGMSIVKNK